MSTEQYNYLSLEEDKDKQEPLIEDFILKKDSSQILEEDNLFSKVKTVQTEDDEEEIKNDEYHQTSNDKESFHERKNEEIYKKEEDKPIKKLVWICIICTIFMIIEIVGGYLANSIAIMTEAAHLLSDLLGFLVSIISIYISKKVAKTDMSYGYHRSDILGAIVSIVLTWALIIWLIYESTLRMITTPQGDGLIMIIISIIGFSFNVIMGKILSETGAKNSDSDEKEKTSQDEDENKNNNLSRSSFIHSLGDTLQNVGLLIAGGIIFLFPNFSIADPICTYIFCIISVFTTIRILKDCIFVLMEGSPVDIDIEELENDLKYIKGVKDIHDLYVRSLGNGQKTLSCHIYCDDPQKTLKKAKKMIKKKYNIENITIQVEDNIQNQTCKNNNLH